ncbi:hypothetical protein Tco_1267904 [Tanacetum coccineum]
MAAEPNDVRRTTIKCLRQELVADVELANNLLFELNRYLEQLRTRAPKLLRVESLLDHPFIKGDAEMDGCMETSLGCRMTFPKREETGKRGKTWENAGEMSLGKGETFLQLWYTDPYLGNVWGNMWDVGGDDFGTLEDTGFLEFASLSLDELELERVFFSEDTTTN